MQAKLRNALIGGGVLSFRALFFHDYGLFALLFILGMLAGLLYTGLEPVFRGRPRLRYVPWLICAYGILGVEVGVGLVKHDEMSEEAIRNPWGVIFLLVLGAVGAYAAARNLEPRDDSHS